MTAYPNGQSCYHWQYLSWLKTTRIRTRKPINLLLTSDILIKNFNSVRIVWVNSAFAANKETFDCFYSMAIVSSKAVGIDVNLSAKTHPLTITRGVPVQRHVGQSSAVRRKFAIKAAISRLQV